jgi:cytochrome c peroxidase
MRWNLGTFATPILAVPLLLSGCGGAGTETSTPPGSGPAGGEAGAQASAASPAAKKGIEREEPIEPVRRVDPKSVVDVVKGDVKGGEALLGPTPDNELYLPPDESLIKDEPLTIEPPLGLSGLITPLSNPLTKGKVELGKQLYFDPRISLDGTVSCATCHNPEKAWTDRMATSIGIDGQVGSRNAPTVLNTVYGQTMFWDGRAPSLEAQSQGPPQNPIEMGKQSYKMIVERLRTIPGYTEQFKQVFGTDVTIDGMVKAIASFERATAHSGNSKYDKYIQGDNKALSESEKRGMVLFGIRPSDDDTDFKYDVTKNLKKANCTSCHVGANFTDEQFHNLGIGWNRKEAKFADFGRFAVEPIGAKNPASMGAFKTPTVREVSQTAPYMHDGSLSTLEAVVDHYDKGGNANPYLDKDMKKLNLSKEEKADVIAFMKALDGEPIKVALPTLPPGPDGKTPDPSAALTPPAPKAAMNIFHPTIAR